MNEDVTVRSDGSYVNPRLKIPLNEKLFAECESMLRFALGRGCKLPSSIFPLFECLKAGQPSNLSEIIVLHNRMAEIIAPAKPNTIYLLEQDAQFHRVINHFGPLPNIRYLMMAALVFIFVFVGTTMTPNINFGTLSKSVYDETLVGTDLFFVTFFLLSAAGLGASYNALFSAYRYIGEGTYDTRYDNSYWIRILLGLIAGLSMSQLIPMDQWLERSNSNVSSDKEVYEYYAAISKPLLALLGGFSVTMVNTILHRLVETLESLFSGSPEGINKQKEIVIRAKLNRQFDENRFQAARYLIALKEAVNNNAPPEYIQLLATKALNSFASDGGNELEADRFIEGGST
jgi:hypothetical protein